MLDHAVDLLVAEPWETRHRSWPDSDDIGQLAVGISKRRRAGIDWTTDPTFADSTVASLTRLLVEIGAKHALGRPATRTQQEGCTHRSCAP